MHIETTAGQLKKALKTVRPVASGRKVTPILSCVRIRTGEGGAAHLDATDLDIDMRVDIAVSSASRGAAFVLDHAVLTRLVGNLPAEENVLIEGYVDGNAVLTFRASRYRLASLPAGKWPETGAIGDPVSSGDVDERFGEALRFCLPCISTEETRYYLNGVCLDGREMVATDGVRMATCASGLALPADARPIVPRDAVRLLIAARDVSHLEIGKLRVVAQVPGARITAKRIDASYPDWRRVVPGAVAAGAEGLMRIDLDRAETMEALTRLMAVHSGANLSTGMVLAQGRVALGALVSDIGSGEEHLRKAEWRWHDEPPSPDAAGPMVVGLNATYLREALGTWRGAARVTMWQLVNPEADRGSNPAVFTVNGDFPPPVIAPDGEEPGRRLVLMPQRLWKRSDGVVTDIAARMAREARALEAAE